MSLQTKAEKEPIIITLNSRPYEIKRTVRAIQFRVLPSLRKAPQDEPINFIRYERAKREKKVQTLKNPKVTDLFLEGEYFVSGPEQLRSKKAKNGILDISTIPQFERKQTYRAHEKHKNKSFISIERCVEKE